ncbi:MAG: GAF domain-containing protein [Thermoplasmata archaeon]|jgi:GAF domain-containing protein|nr:GAF domain-containing protein [Thermoplasmata archaeon]
MTVHPREVTPSLLHVEAILGRLKGRAALSEVCRFLRMEFPHYRWAGVYRLDGSTLVLEGWSGEAGTEHTRIPIERGICGRAARENRSIVVADVRQEPDYLSCFLDTRSEIVVPIREGTAVLGEIDIDGTTVGAYDESDARFLESIATRLTGAVRAAALEPAPPG